MDVQLQPLSPKEALAWFKAKGLQPTFDWKDLWRACQENAFAISGVAELDLLDDMHDEIGRAIDEGLSLEQFQADAEKILRYHGWWGPAIAEDPITGRKRKINLGNANRLRTIYRTNIGGALNAGRSEHIAETAAARLTRGGGMTYLKFNAVGQSARTCGICRELDGMIRPFNDPIWGWCTPTLHFNCRCVIESLTERDIKDFNYKVSAPREIRTRQYRNGRTGHTVHALEGVQPGFGRHDWDGQLHEELQAYLKKASPENRKAIETRRRDLFPSAHAAATHKYNPGEPRGDHGRWVAGGTGSDKGGGRGGKSKGFGLRPVKEHAFNGEPVTIKSKLPKLGAGELGEKIALDYIRDKLKLPNADTLHLKTANHFPVDLIGDHELIEVKTGLASNGKSAQHWRATIGQPGKEETKWLRTASPEAKRAWNQRKADAIMERKQKVLREFSKKLGKQVRGRTVALILNPDKKLADVYVFKGFHHRIPWNGPQAHAGYAATYRYGELGHAAARPTAVREIHHGTLEASALKILKEGFEPHRPEYMGRRISGVWGAEDKARALAYGFDRARTAAQAYGKTPKTLRAAVVTIKNPAEAGFKRENFDPHEKRTWVAPHKVSSEHIKQVEIYETPYRPRADVIDMALKALKSEPAKTVHAKEEIVYMVLLENDLAEPEAHEDDDAA